ncbi:MAG: alpha/beta hydrolase [Pirellulales bacterium]
MFRNLVMQQTGTCLVLTFLAAAVAAKEEPALEPIVVDLTTKDQVLLKATFYGQPVGSRAVPVVLLHDCKGSRNTFDGLASFLQERGFAVVVPDLRGHGRSTRQRVDGPAGIRTLEASSLRKPDFICMVKFDMEAVRRFLVSKNDQEVVNLNALCLVGAEMSATIAINWTAKDWMMPPLAIKKQGQDVKAVVLLSPQMSFKGVPVKQALAALIGREIRDKISYLILVGDGDSRGLRDARRIEKTLSKWHTRADHGTSVDKQTLFFHAVPTSLKGTKLLTADGNNIQNGIARFLKLRVVDQDFPWIKRRTGG